MGFIRDRVQKKNKSQFLGKAIYLKLKCELVKKLLIEH